MNRIELERLSDDELRKFIAAVNEPGHAIVERAESILRQRQPQPARRDAMTVYERTFAKISKLNPTHLETLAVALHSTLNGLPREAFEETARFAERMGAEWLERFHEEMTA